MLAVINNGTIFMLINYKKIFKADFLINNVVLKWNAAQEKMVLALQSRD